MLRISTRATLALAMACALGACNREDEAEKQAPLPDSVVTQAPSPVTTELAAWDVRFDGPAADAGGLQMSEEAGGGWAVKTGPTGGAVTWRDRDMVEGGGMQVKATLAARSAADAGSGYGIFVGGRHLKDPDQAYTSFLIRGTGEYMIKRREGASSPTYVDWTPNAAIQKAAAAGAGAPVQNTLEVRAEPDVTHFFVNGTEVKSLPTDQAQPYGTAGLRLDQGIDLTMTSFEMHGAGAAGAAPAADSHGAVPR